MDFHMPEMDGFEATRQIRTVEKYLGMSVPVCGLTGDDLKANPDAETNAMSSGMNQIILKPVNLDILQELIGKYA